MSRRALLAAVPLTLILGACSSGQDHTTMGAGGTMAPGQTMAPGAPMDHGGATGSGAPGTTQGTMAPIPAGADHNAQDVTFSQEMILHHAQAITMAEMALQNAVDPRVKDLAGRVKAAQGPEIDQLRGWLKTWGQTASDPNAPHDMAGMNMPSMMSADDMKNLEGQTGTGFDRLFLEQMIRHHEGAVTMARTEKDKGKYPSAITMADAIVTSQSAEITEMRAILG